MKPEDVPVQLERLDRKIRELIKKIDDEINRGNPWLEPDADELGRQWELLRKKIEEIDRAIGRGWQHRQMEVYAKQFEAYSTQYGELLKQLCQRPN